MTKRGPRKSGRRGDRTRLVELGRDPAAHHGFVNPPLYRGSTVLFPTVEALEGRKQDYVYGRRGTPTMRALETALAELEGGHRTFLAPSGLSAICATLLAFVRSGDRILVTDSIYQPTRRFCDEVLTRLGVETVYYDPLAGAGISSLMRNNTRLVLTESPGSQTFEVQDVPAIAKAAREAGATVILDNTWASPLYFKPFDHGVDVSVHSATKYILGHSDALLGVITASESATPAVAAAIGDMGLCPGPEDVFLALRGLRTLSVRLERHWRSGLKMAEWLNERPEVSRILHPAHPSHPGHGIWKRDFTGACGLFAVILKPHSKKAVSAMLDNLELFGMGWSWGGFESLCVPVDPAPFRTAVPWAAEGPLLRFHIGLEDVDDLKADLEAGFARLRAGA